MYQSQLLLACGDAKTVTQIGNYYVVLFARVLMLSRPQTLATSWAIWLLNTGDRRCQKILSYSCGLLVGKLVDSAGQSEFLGTQNAHRADALLQLDPSSPAMLFFQTVTQIGNYYVAQCARVLALSRPPTATA